jgi:hypothetical protein
MPIHAVVVLVIAYKLFVRLCHIIILLQWFNAIILVREIRTFRFVLRLITNLGLLLLLPFFFASFFFVDKLNMLITSNQNCLGEL